jgi:hypothetical protein
VKEKKFHKKIIPYHQIPVRHTGVVIWMDWTGPVSDRGKSERFLMTDKGNFF